MKKILKMISAVIMTVCLAVPVMAVPIGQNGYVTSNEATLSIPKGVVMFNDIAGNYYGPDISYTYTIEPATPPTGATIQSNNTTAEVHTGIEGAVTISETPSFTSVTKSMSPTGVEDTDNLVLNVNAAAFPKPGVYRYLLTDTTATSALFEAGITRTTNYQTTRYLDVYLERDTDTTLKVSGYVLMKENPTLNDGTIQKSVGYIQADNLGDDSYHTYNITLAKDVQGSMGDRTHEFPFSATINNAGKTYFWAENQTDLAQFATTDFTAVSLKHNDIVHIRGLNPHATVSYTETQDVQDIYSVKVTGNGTVLVAEAPKEVNQTTTLAASAVTTYDTANSTSSVNAVGTLNNVGTTVFVNTMEAVSPTGVVMRFMPYILMLGAGIFLLALSRRREEA